MTSKPELELSDILPKLRERFPVEDYLERDLPGGKLTWYYLKWQTMRDRLNKICPDLWHISYSQPIYLGELCSITCTITILGLSRQGVGSAPIVQLSNKGKDMSRGDAIQRARADAFRSGAEEFGIGAEVDEQADDRTRKEFIKYMHSGGNSRPADLDHRQAKPPAKPVTSQPSNTAFGGTGPIEMLSERQRRDLYAIARNEGGHSPESFKVLLSKDGITTGTAIPLSLLGALRMKAANKDLAAACQSEVVTDLSNVN